jgi:hypothetical protein
MKRAVIFSAGVLLAVSAVVVASTKKKIVLGALVVVAAGELLYGFIKFNPFVPALFVYPATNIIESIKPLTGINRIWGYGTAGIEANFATQLGLYSPDGTDPLNLNWYNRFVQASREGNVAVTFNRTTRSDAQIAPGYGKEDLPNNEFRLRIMDALGVRYVLDRTENANTEVTFPPARFKLLSHIDDWVVYENIPAAPRFFVTGDVRTYTDTQDFEHQFFATDFQPGKSVLIAQSERDTLPQLSALQGTASLISYTPNEVAITTATQGNQLLFLSDTYDNGWTATVNGKSATVLKADFSFRAVAVPKGESNVIFSYKPKSFSTGLAISALALIFTIAYFITIR